MICCSLTSYGTEVKRSPTARSSKYSSLMEKEECQRGELNSRPRAYESPALPLSYPGECGRKSGRAATSCQRLADGAGAVASFSRTYGERSRFSPRSAAITPTPFFTLTSPLQPSFLL